MSYQQQQSASDVKVKKSVYNHLSNYLMNEYIKDPLNEEVENMYKELTGDINLSSLKNKMVHKEIEEFTESISNLRDEKGNRPFSIEDCGYDSGVFYIRFWATDFKFINDNYKNIINFLQNVTDRTGVVISPEFTFYEHLQPSNNEVEEIVEAPKISYSKRMEVELNEA